MLRQKESDLEKTENLLNNFQFEVQLLSEERKRLIGLQNNLELELKTSAQAHRQLEEQKTENEKLKEVIDSLKTDLDEALFQQNNNDLLLITTTIKEEQEDQVDETRVINRKTSCSLSVKDEESHVSFKVGQHMKICTTN
jgi:cell division protein FtsB